MMMALTVNMAFGSLFKKEQLFVNKDVTLFSLQRVSDEYHTYSERVSIRYPNHTLDPVDFTI